MVHVIVLSYSSQHDGCWWPDAYLDMTAANIVMTLRGRRTSGMPNMMDQFSCFACKRRNSCKKMRQKAVDKESVNGIHGYVANYTSQ